MGKVNSSGYAFLMGALHANDLAKIRYAVEQYGIDLAQDEFPVFHPVLTAVRECGPDILEYFLDQGVAGGLESEGNPLLFWACLESEPRNVTLLLAHGADIHKRNKDGLTALMYAANSPEGEASVEIARILIAHGADRAALDGRGADARFWAREADNGGVLALLDAADAAVAASAASRRRRLQARAVAGLL